MEDQIASSDLGVLEPPKRRTLVSNISAQPEVDDQGVWKRRLIRSIQAGMHKAEATAHRGSSSRRERGCASTQPSSHGLFWLWRYRSAIGHGVAFARAGGVWNLVLADYGVDCASALIDLVPLSVAASDAFVIGAARGATDLRDGPPIVASRQ